jgi:hypothetical protein
MAATTQNTTNAQPALPDDVAKFSDDDNSGDDDNDGNNGSEDGFEHNNHYERVKDGPRSKVGDKYTDQEENDLDDEHSLISHNSDRPSSFESDDSMEDFSDSEKSPVYSHTNIPRLRLLDNDTLDCRHTSNVGSNICSGYISISLYY